MSTEAQPFWDAAAEGRLLLPRCTACGVFIWYPRDWCPECLSREIEWIEASGRGTIYSHTTVRRGAPPALRDAVPYVVAVVELDEGPRMLTNVVTEDPGALQVGEPVELIMQEETPRFRPVTS